MLIIADTGTVFDSLTLWKNVPLCSFPPAPVPRFLFYMQPVWIGMKNTCPHCNWSSHIPYQSFSSSQLWRQKRYTLKICMQTGLKNTIQDMVSSYRETLRNLPCWLSECQHPGTSREYGGGLDVLEGWSGTLLHKDKTHQVEPSAAENNCNELNIMLQLPLSSLFEDCKKRNSNTFITNNIHFL